LVTAGAYLKIPNEESIVILQDPQWLPQRGNLDCIEVICHQWGRVVAFKIIFSSLKHNEKCSVHRIQTNKKITAVLSQYT